MKKLLVLVLATALFSCKSKQALVSEQKADASMTAKEIAQGHYKNVQDFKTAQIKAKIKYEGGGNSVSMDADIRIKKGEMILVSITAVGFPLAKGMATPKGISYYSKLDAEYFEGNYEGLNELLKIDTNLNYEKVENILLGEAMDNLSKGNYKVTLQEGLYKLFAKGSDGIITEFQLDGNYLLKQQQIKEEGNFPRHLSITYPGYKETSHGKYPSNVNIEAQDDIKVNIDVEYKSLEFDKEGLKFNYSVPEGLKKISLD